jgi:hypothetical protein
MALHFSDQIKKKIKKKEERKKREGKEGKRGEKEKNRASKTALEMQKQVGKNLALDTNKSNPVSVSNKT